MWRRPLHPRSVQSTVWQHTSDDPPLYHQQASYQRCWTHVPDTPGQQWTALSASEIQPRSFAVIMSRSLFCVEDWSRLSAVTDSRKLSAETLALVTDSSFRCGLLWSSFPRFSLSHGIVTKPHDRQSEIVSGKQALVSDNRFSYQLRDSVCCQKCVNKTDAGNTISVSEQHEVPGVYERQTDNVMVILSTLFMLDNVAWSTLK